MEIFSQNRRFNALLIVLLLLTMTVMLHCWCSPIHGNNIPDKFISVIKILEALLALIASVKLFFIGMQPMARQFKIEYLSFVVLVGFFAAVVFHYILGFYWGDIFPNSTFISYTLGGQFGDFYMTLAQSLHLDPYNLHSRPGVYFPFAYLFIHPLTFLNKDWLIFAYNLFFIAVMFSFVKIYFSHPAQNQVERTANYKNFFILSVMSYPFLFSLERGNIEIILFALVASSIYFYQRQKFTVTVICLAIASAMKLYPIFLLVLFLSDRRYLLAIKTGLLTITLTLLAALVLKPDFQTVFMSSLSSVLWQKNICLLVAKDCIKFNAGIWGALKILQQNEWQTAVSLPSVFKLYYFYTITTAIGLIIFSLYTLFIETVFWRKLAMVFLAILLFPIASGDYKLLYLFIPLAAFVAEKPERFDLGYLTLFAILLIPKNYYWLRYDTGIDSVLTPIFLSLLAVCIMVDGVSRKFFSKINLVGK